MKIYFAGSIRGGREMVETYREIIVILQEYGQVLTEHVGNKDITSYGQVEMSSQEIFIKDTNWIREADVVVADVTMSSLGVGYELGFAEAQGKRVICLYNGDIEKLSAMVSGNKNFEVHTYESVDQLKDFFESNLQ